MKHQVLQIDAWAGCDEGSWEWNNWYKIAKTDTIPDTVEQFLALLGADADASKFEIEDDGHNIVLIHIEDREPLFAVEYGNTI